MLKKMMNMWFKQEEHLLIMLITVYENEGRSIKEENDSGEGEEEATNTNNDASTLTYHYIYETPMKEQ